MCRTAASSGSGSRSTHARLADITVAAGGCVATFVLIPGAGGHAAYWNRLIPELETRGQGAIAVDIKEDDPSMDLDGFARLWKLQCAITRTSSSSPSHSV